MKDMKMKTKMIIGFIIPIVLTILNVILGMSSVRNIAKDVNVMQKEELTSVSETMQTRQKRKSL